MHPGRGVDAWDWIRKARNDPSLVKQTVRIDQFTLHTDVILPFNRSRPFWFEPGRTSLRPGRLIPDDFDVEIVGGGTGDRYCNCHPDRDDLGRERRGCLRTHSELFKEIRQVADELPGFASPEQLRRPIGQARGDERRTTARNGQHCANCSIGRGWRESPAIDQENRRRINRLEELLAGSGSDRTLGPKLIDPPMRIAWLRY